jgi:FlaA1/EpsC-like NDP-sugar epimerase
MSSSEEKRVLITGGAGSIGSELVLHYVKAGWKVWALDHDDSRLAVLETKIQSDQKHRFLPVLASVRQKDECVNSISLTRANLVIHTAALKQVPLLEDFPKMAYQTNVVGTQNVIAACKKTDAKLVFISTDKAVDAVSVMGQTKAKSEYEVLGYEHGMVVRLPNIMWTRGALRDLVLSSQQTQGEVELTSAEMKRWWLEMGDGVRFIRDVAEHLETGYVYAPTLARERKVIDVIEEIGNEVGIEFMMNETKPRSGERFQESLWSAETEEAVKLDEYNCWKISSKKSV